MSEQGATAQARDRAQEAAGQAQQKAQDVAGQAQEKAQEATGQARDAVRSQIDRRSRMAGEQVHGRASDLRSVGEQLRQQGQERPAKLAEQIADRIERLGSYLEEADAERILDDVEDMARRNPWAVMAGGFALGLVASRLMKASSQERYEYRSSTGDIPRRRALPRRSADEQRFTRPTPSSTAPQGTIGGRGTSEGRPASRPVPPAPSVPPPSPTEGR